MRVRPGVTTVTAIHAYLAQVVGNPGLAVEIVDTLAPTIDSSNIFYPATDTGNNVAGWENQANGTLVNGNLQSAARYNPTTYGKVTAALAAGATNPLSFRSLGASLSSKRVLQVVTGFTAVNTLTGFPTSISDQNVGISSDLVIGGTTYNGPLVQIPLNNAWYDKANAATWAVNPSKVAVADPSWAQSDVNTIINGTDSFGCTPHGKLAAAALWVASIYCNPIVVPENRHGQSYVFNAPPRTGWNKQTLSATVALLANTWYWVIISCPNASPTNYAVVPVFNYATALPTATVGSGTGEHRQEAQAQLNTTVGVPSPSPTTLPNYAIPVLLDASGSILSQSQPYVGSWVWTINSSPHDNQSPQTTLVTPGQQITTPGGGPFAVAALQVQVYAEGGSSATPSQPLVISIRSGAGGISGAGVLVATATLQPNRCIAGQFFGLVPLDGGTVNLASTTTYYVEFASTAPTGTGWQIIEADTRSDLATIGGSTVNAVEGATIGGQTDGIINNGALVTRYDLGVAFITAPTAPAGFAVTQLPPVVGPVPSTPAGVGAPIPPDILPPRLLLTWNATANGSNFLAYNIYRRPRATPTLPWLQIASITVPAGYTAATVEAQHTSFIDYEAGWSVVGTRYASGWDYSITVQRADTGLESAVGSTLSTANPMPGSNCSWVTCNSAPWLNFPLYVHETSEDALAQLADTTSRTSMFGNVLAYEIQGRDYGITRTRLGTPPRTITLGFEQLGALPSWIFDPIKAASKSGRQVRLLECRGDAYNGSIVFPDINRPNQVKITAKAKFHVTAPVPVVANYNRPCRIVLNGTSQYATTPSASQLNPGAEPWACMVAAVFNNRQNDVYLSDGSVVANALGQFGIYCPNTGQMRGSVHGSGGSLTLTHTSGTWFDGNLHVAFLVFDGTNYLLYLDDIATPVASANGTAVGSITNGVALVAGADNGGASGFTASSIQAWGMWYNTKLAASDVQNTARYVLGYAGYRAAPGAAAFYNAADARCWNGVAATLSDLSLTVQPATLVAAPPTKGIPFSLVDLDTVW